MAPAARLLLAALGAALCAVASAGNLAIPWVAYGLLPSNSNQDPAIVTALPPGMSNLDPAALVYFVRWLQCSSLVQWCTPSEVYLKVRTTAFVMDSSPLLACAYVCAIHASRSARTSPRAHGSGAPFSSTRRSRGRTA